MEASSRWRVVVPVKGGPEAKSRLTLAAAQRRTIATAMALDCLAACLATPEVGLVVCVTDDPAVAAEARRVGAATVSAGGPGLAVAISAGLASLAPGPVAVLVADLPCLTPGDLGAALRAAGEVDAPALVTDAEGSGSVLLAARAGRLPHRFGAGSAQAHEAAGARRVLLPLPTLRRDVDTLDALSEALEMGVGARTREALVCVPVPPPVRAAAPPVPAPPVPVPPVPVQPGAAQPCAAQPCAAQPCPEEEPA